MSQAKLDLIIVGGGFAACSAMNFLAQNAPSDWRILILTGSDGPNAGMGYATSDKRLLLNASHANMSLTDHEPNNFSKWLSNRGRGEGDNRFVSRQTYGLYLRDAWAISLTIARRRGLETHIVPQSAQQIVELDGQSVVIADDAGARHCSVSALICEGPTLRHFDTSDPKRVISPLWPNNLSGLAQAKGHVIIIGTGLSALDAAIAALAVPEVTHVTMISRSGKLPLAHLPIAALLPITALLQQLEGTPRAVLSQIRRLAAIYPWQNVMDGVRAVTNKLWLHWTPAQRRGAMCHLVPVWSLHRSRAPASVVDDVSAAQSQGRLYVRKGVFAHFACTADGILIELQGVRERLECDVLIDARGYQRITQQVDSFCGRALADQYFQVADIGYGVACSDAHRATGSEHAPIHVVGAARYGDLLETTGAPEIRAQVRQSLIALLAPAPD